MKISAKKIYPLLWACIYMLSLSLASPGTPPVQASPLPQDLQPQAECVPGPHNGVIAATKTGAWPITLTLSRAL
jgi:hypothetical protein